MRFAATVNQMFGGSSQLPSWEEYWQGHCNQIAEYSSDNETVQIAQMQQLSIKTQQRFSVFGTCFHVSNIIISHYKCLV